MGLKKYEIITVGSDKRVRALRSWRVQDRYVNIGDVGGIVYDEKTLSQDGACWLFKGNFGFPGARIGGDSIVDVGEAAPDATGSANLDILGTSTVVGAPVKFTVGLGAVNGLVFSASYFEQGDLTYSKGMNWETWKNPSGNFIRLKSPVFMGGVAATLKLDVLGYSVQAFVMDRDGIGTLATASVSTGEGVTLTVPAGQYFTLKLRKDPVGAIVPYDATAAQIATTAVFETKLVVVDSRLELNPANGTGAIAIRSGGSYSVTPGAKYPDTVIQNSKVVINSHASTARMIRLISEFIGCNVAIDATAGDSQGVGIYSSVSNLTFTGVVATNWNVAGRSIIQATNCNNFAVSPTIFPGLAAAQTANMPFIFQGCNVPNGKFYHHTQIANTYENIDFAKAQTDLGKTIPGVAYTLVSSETEGMYRIYNTAANLFGFLVESYDSISSIGLLVATATSYGTTIYKDAYVSGNFDFAGTNVFGNTKKHDTQDVSGCKIVNTEETAVNMKGNIRVEGNATLTNCSIIGSGYFGGNCVASGVTIGGCAYMKDNAVIVVPGGSVSIRSLKMTENAYAAPTTYTLNGHLWLSGNSRFIPETATSGNGDLFMNDNTVISGAVSVSGSLTMKDNATVSAGILTAYGDIIVCGSYNQTVSKTWTGKRTITDVNAPEYDDNVKTQYDF